MLVAGAITSIITYIKDYELTKMLWILLGVLVVFYILGLLIQKTLNAFDKEIEEAEKLAKEAEEKEKEEAEKAAGEADAKEDGKQNREKPIEEQDT